MTEKEFDNMAFSKDMLFRYRNKPHKLKAVDFLSRDLGLAENDSGHGLIWIKCTHVKMIKSVL